jgi:hypothetical protein
MVEKIASINLESKEKIRSVAGAAPVAGALCRVPETPCGFSRKQHSVFVIYVLKKT